MSNAINGNSNFDRAGPMPVRRNGGGLQREVALERLEVLGNFVGDRMDVVDIARLRPENLQYLDGLIKNRDRELTRDIAALEKWGEKIEKWGEKIEKWGERVDALGVKIEEFGKALEEQDKALEIQLKALDDVGNKLKEIAKGIERYEANVKARALQQQPLPQGEEQKILSDDKILQTGENMQPAKEAEDILRKEQDAKYEYDMWVRKNYDEMIAKGNKELQDRIDYLGRKIQKILSGRSSSSSWFGKSKNYFYNTKVDYALEVYKSTSKLAVKRHL